jgi:hypothetical protein
MVAGALAGERWISAAADLEAFDEATQAARREAARPVPRRYAVVPR